MKKTENRNDTSNSINGSTLSGLWEHNQKHDCGAITAFKEFKDEKWKIKYSEDEEIERNKILTAKLVSKGYDVTRIVGSFIKDDESTNKPGYFVVDLKDNGTLEDNLVKLGFEFEQDSILFAPKGCINNITSSYLVGTSWYSHWIDFGEKKAVDASKLYVDGKIYSICINGKPFYFDEVEKKVFPPNTGMGFWAMGLYAVKNARNVEYAKERQYIKMIKGEG